MWDWADGWAFEPWPDVEATLDRLEEASEAGAIGAAIDAFAVVRAHHEHFWKASHRPLRPAPDRLLSNAEALPLFPQWAVEALAQLAASRAGAIRHRKNILHRLRFFAVESLRDVREAERLERLGDLDPRGDGVPSLRDMLIAHGLTPDAANAAATRELQRFTPELVRGSIYERVERLVINGTPMTAGVGPESPPGEVTRKSYVLVRDELAQGKFATFYVPSDEALSMLGWGDLVGMKKLIDRKIGSLFGPVPR